MATLVGRSYFEIAEKQSFYDAFPLSCVEIEKVESRIRCKKKASSSASCKFEMISPTFHRRCFFAKSEQTLSQNW